MDVPARRAKQLNASHHSSHKPKLQSNGKVSGLSSPDRCHFPPFVIVIPTRERSEAGGICFISPEIALELTIKPREEHEFLQVAEMRLLPRW
jgi:hypothetical protein